MDLSFILDSTRTALLRSQLCADEHADKENAPPLTVQRAMRAVDFVADTPAAVVNFIWFQTPTYFTPHRLLQILALCHQDVSFHEMYSGAFSVLCTWELQAVKNVQITPRNACYCTHHCMLWDGNQKTTQRWGMIIVYSTWSNELKNIACSVPQVMMKRRRMMTLCVLLQSLKIWWSPITGRR